MPVVGVGVVSCGIVFVSGCLVQTPLVSLGGSTAVLPLINALSPYIDFIDVVTSAGGSGVGISSIIDGTKEIGIASTHPDILSLGLDNYSIDNILKYLNENNDIKQLYYLENIIDHLIQIKYEAQRLILRKYM